MTAPIDRREWLAAKGLAKAGTRGRFSLAAKEALAAAEAEGVIFATAGTATSIVTTINENGERVQETREINIYAPHPEAIREGTLTFVNGANKIAVSASEACAGCRYSFGWCYCETPTFRYWKDSEVYTLV